MKTKRTFFAVAFFSFSMITAFIFSTDSALAAVKTWDGGGPDDNFATATNWNGDTAPITGDSIVLPLDVVFNGCSTTADITLNNNLNSNSVTLAGLSLSGAVPEQCYPASVVVSGNEIKSSGDIGGGYSLKLGVPVVAQANIRIAARSTVTGTAFDIGSHSVTLATRSYDGGITGSGNLNIEGHSGGGGGGCSPSVTNYPFAGDSSGFTGAITLNDGASMNVTGDANSLGRNASSITVNDSFIGFDFNNGESLSLTLPPLTVNGGTLSSFQSWDSDCNNSSTKKLTINSDVTFTKETTARLYYVDLYFAGTVNGREYLDLPSGEIGTISFADGEVVKSELKVFSIDDVAGCSDLSRVSGANSKIVINADCTQSEYYKYDTYPLGVRGILAGNGRTGNIEVISGGIVAPGLSPGTLTVSNIEWAEGGIYEFEIGKDAADKIISNGTVTLGNGTLRVLRFDNYVPQAGANYVIIDNDGSDAVSGTFKDLPEGSAFTTEDGAVYRISYVGGDGNDVVVTVVSAPRVPNTGFGLMKNNPIITVAVTTVSAGVIALIARRRSLLG